MTDTKELRKLAEAAAALDHNENASWYEEKYLLGMAYYPKNARFIAAANPQTIIALLDTIEAQAAEIEELKASTITHCEWYAARNQITHQAALLKRAKTALMYYDFGNGVPQAAVAAIEQWENGK